MGNYQRSILSQTNWNHSPNLHGNRDAYLNPDDSTIYKLTEARAHFADEKPIFCTDMKDQGKVYIGGGRPVRLLSQDSGWRNGFLYMYKYNELGVFHVIHREDGNFIARYGSGMGLAGGNGYHRWMGVTAGFETTPIALSLERGDMREMAAALRHSVGDDLGTPAARAAFMKGYLCNWESECFKPYGPTRLHEPEAPLAPASTPQGVAIKAIVAESNSNSPSSSVRINAPALVQWQAGPAYTANGLQPSQHMTVDQQTQDSDIISHIDANPIYRQELGFDVSSSDPALQVSPFALPEWPYIGGRVTDQAGNLIIPPPGYAVVTSFVPDTTPYTNADGYPLWTQTSAGGYTYHADGNLDTDQ